MKAAVITLHSVCNYGTQLQAYATQEKLKQYFDDVVFIDYKRPDTYGVKLLKTFTKGNILKAPAILPTIIYWKRNFGGFQKRYLNLTDKKYLSLDDFDNFEDVADIYFSGSDQVWNTGWNNGIIPPMYLSFLDDSKPRYSYSSSFGTSALDDKYLKETKQYLKKYKMISVREESGVKIVKNQLGIENCIRIVDPTLALEPEFWRKIAPKKKIKGDYILIYNLNRSKEFDEYAEKLAEKTGMKLYRFCTRLDQIFRNGKSIVMPEILDFITLVDNAKYVLTDSFHATAFSINLNTEPICIYPNNYSGRLSSFLELVDSTQRHVKDYNDFDVINRHTDFAKVNKILDKERKKVDYFLNKIVEENGETMENKEKIDNEPLISIIIPVYNEENYLKDTINAVINQEYKNLEIIIVDDGSKDNSRKIIDYYANIDNRIKTIYKENSGVSNSRNIALDSAMGKYVCFMDADDYISKDYVSYLYKILKETNAEISLVPTPQKFTSQSNIDFNISSENKDDKIEIWTGKKATEEMLYYRIKESSWCKLISMDLINKYKIRFNPELKCGEGFNFCTTCLQRAKRVAVGHKIIYFYRVDNPHSAMTKFNIDMIRNGIKAIKLIDNNLIERDNDLVKASHYAFWHTHCDFFNTMVGCKAKDKYPEDYKEIKKICRKYANCSFSSHISTKEKVKGSLYLISPYITAKIINSFRLRKFTLDTDK